jgi:hypothetical protein
MIKNKLKKQQKAVSFNLRELKNEATIILSQMRDAENQAKLAVIKEFNPNAYVSIDLAKKALTAILNDTKAKRSSAKKKANLANAKHLLTNIDVFYLKSLIEKRKQTDLLIFKAGVLCSFFYKKKDGTVTTRMGTASKIAKDTQRNKDKKEYQGGRPAFGITTYIEFEIDENNEAVSNGFKSFIDDNFMGIKTETENSFEFDLKNDNQIIKLQLPDYFSLETKNQAIYSREPITTKSEIEQTAGSHAN